MTPTYPRQRSIAQHTAIVLAVAGFGAVAGALFYGTTSHRNESVQFVRAAQAAEARDPSPASETIPPAAAIEWDRSSGERILEPRECDLAKGISSACLWMD